MKVYIVKIAYDYESVSMYGIFSDKTEAERHKEELNENSFILGILGGVYVMEEEVDKLDWDIFEPDESGDDDEL